MLTLQNEACPLVDILGKVEPLNFSEVDNHYSEISETFHVRFIG